MRALLAGCVLLLAGCQLPGQQKYLYYPDAKGGIWRVDERGSQMAHCVAEPPRIVCSWMN